MSYYNKLNDVISTLTGTRDMIEQFIRNTQCKECGLRCRVDHRAEL